MMDLYAEDLADYIYQESDVDKKETCFAVGSRSGNQKAHDVVVCHAVHDICTHKPYSIPDLLRLNDFWVEAHLVCQHIIDQNGKRYNPN